MAPALHLPTDSDNEATTPIIGRASVGGGWGAIWRRLALLGLGACAFGGCVIVIGTSATRAPVAMSGATDPDGSDTLASLLLAASPDAASDGDSLAAALLDSGNGHPSVGTGELFDGLLEDDAQDHNHDGTAVHAVAGSLQQKFNPAFIMGIAGPVALMNGALRANADLRAKKAWWGKQEPERSVKWLWFMFKDADKDANGFIEGPEVKTLSQALRLRFNLTSDWYDQLYTQAGSNKDGKLDFGELKLFAGVLFVLGVADKDRDSSLSSEELSVGAFALGKLLSWAHLGPDDFAKLLREADVDADAKLSPSELKHMLKAAQDFFLPLPLAAIFKKLDVDGSESLDGSELETVSKALQNKFGLAPSYLETILTQSPNGSLVKLDRRAFKQLIWKAWGGSPFAGVGPWKTIVFFKKADKDESFSIDGKELHFVISSFEDFLWIEGPESLKLVGTVDRDSDGKLSPEEFGMLVHEALARSPFTNMCRKEVDLFKSLDLNHNHAIDGLELNSFSLKMQQWFKAATQERISEEVAAADADADRQLSPPELRQVVQSLASRPAAMDGRSVSA